MQILCHEKCRIFDKSSRLCCLYYPQGLQGIMDAVGIYGGGDIVGAGFHIISGIAHCDSDGGLAQLSRNNRTFPGNKGKFRERISI